MNKEIFDDYIRRFNDRDSSAFDDYLSDDVLVVNGTLNLQGISGMKAHYQKIWQGFDEVLHVERFVSDERCLAVQMWTHFRVITDQQTSVFGRVKAGETFDFHGLIMYEIRDGKFSHIQVAYNSFTFTDLQGNKTELGIPH